MQTFIIVVVSVLVVTAFVQIIRAGKKVSEIKGKKV